MKCAYESVMERQAEDKAHEELTDLCEKLGFMWLAFIEAVSENAAADVFGVGRRKLRQMRDETQIDLNEYMCLYAADNPDTGESEDIWEVTQTSSAGLLSRLKQIGVDLKALAGEHPIVDTYCDNWHTEHDLDMHTWRRSYVENMEVKLSVYFAVLLLWWHGSEGYGAGKLTRYYLDIRRKYAEFARVYLEKRAGWRNTMEKMTKAEQDRLQKRGVKFEKAENKPHTVLAIPVSEEFRENLVKFALEFARENRKAKFK